MHNHSLFTKAACMVAVLIAIAALSIGAAQAKSWDKKETRNIVIIGDRVVDIAYNLGVVPAAMGVRCSLWPLCDKIKTQAQPLGCPRCLSHGKRDKLFNFIKKNKVKQVIIEKSDPYCILNPDVDPLDSVEDLQKMGMDIKYVDFTKGVVPAIEQTADLLDKKKAGKELIEKYNKAVAKLTQKTKGVNLAKRVVILNGIYQQGTGKVFIRVEVPGGYSDQFILEPLGCKNVGEALVAKGKKPTNGHVTIRKLDGLAKAKPDVIVITGDSTAVQKALAKAKAQNSELCAIPVYSLPKYIDSSVIERPQIVSKWFWALN